MGSSGKDAVDQLNNCLRGCHDAGMGPDQIVTEFIEHRARSDRLLYNLLDRTLLTIVIAIVGLLFRHDAA
jgi:hypothetical protein